MSTRRAARCGPTPRARGAARTTLVATTVATAFLLPGGVPAAAAASGTELTGTKEVGADGYTVEGFTAATSSTLVKVKDGDVDGVHLSDGSVDGSDRVLDMISNGGTLNDVTIRRVEATDLRRGLLRLREASNITVEDVTATGREEPDDHYPTGIATSDLPVEGLTVRRAVFEGFVGKQGSYGDGNGDGLATEERTGTEDLDGDGEAEETVVEDVEANGNADGGGDFKGRVRITRFSAEDNYRNLRFWGAFVVTDVTSIDPRNAHIWLGGGDRLKGGTITRPTFIGGSDVPHIKVDSETPAVTVTIVDPVVPDGEELRIEEEGGSKANIVVKYTTRDKAGVTAKRPAPPRLDGAADEDPAAGPTSPIPSPRRTSTSTTAAGGSTSDATTRDLEELAADLAAAQARLAEIAEATTETTGGAADLRDQLEDVNELASRPLP